MATEVAEFGFGENDDIAAGKTEKFKGETGKTARISFAYWKTVDGKLDLTAKSPVFIGGKRHYVAGVGYFLNKGPEYTKIAGAPPKTSVATVIVQWPTDAEGQLAKDRIKDFKVLPWIFAGDKYDALKRIHGQFGFGSHDVLATCTDSGFQKMTFAPCTDSMLKTFLASKAGDSLTQKILKVASELSTEFARDLSIDQIREKLGGSASSPGGAAVSEEDVNNILNDILVD